jgi:ATP-dependent RNA helicase DOB1
MCAFAAGAEGLFMVVDERGVFRDDNFQAAVAALQDSTAAAATKGAAGGMGKGQAKTVRGCAGQRNVYANCCCVHL